MPFLKRPRPALRPPIWLVLPAIAAAAIALVQSAPGTRQAQAQTGTGGTGGTGGTSGSGGTTLSMSDFEHEIFVQRKKDEWEPLRGAAVENFFNRARCECDTPVKFRINVALASRNKVRTLTDADLSLRVGDSSCYCNTPADCKQQNCTNLSDRTFE